MSRKIPATLLGPIALLVTARWAASVPLACAPTPSIDAVLAPKPSWVERAPVPASRGPNLVEHGVEHLLADTQVRLSDGEPEIYRRRVMAVAGPAGLTLAAHHELTWHPPDERLALHRVLVQRDGHVMPAFDASSLRIVSREPRFGDQVLSGDLSLLVEIDDVRIGDVVDLEWTVTGMNPALEGRFATSILLCDSAPLRRARVSLLTPVGRPVTVAPFGLLPATPTEKHRSDGLERTWLQGDVGPCWPTDGRHVLTAPRLQVSDWGSWAEVAAWGSDVLRPDETSPAVRALAARIAAEHASPAARALAALRFVSDEVRYLHVGLEGGRYRPTEPSELLRRRAGDCKDKTVLLVSLLRAMGMDAAPALVATWTDMPPEMWLPAPGRFDHAVAALRLDGMTRWLETTVHSSRPGLAECIDFPYVAALVAEAGTTGLVTPPPVPRAAVPTTVRAEVDARERGAPVRLDITTTYSGKDAGRARWLLAEQSREAVLATRRQAARRWWPGLVELAPATVADDPESNRITVVESWRIEGFWREDATTGRQVGRLDLPHVAAISEDSGLAPEARTALLPSSPWMLRVNVVALLPRGARARPGAGMTGAVELARTLEQDGTTARLDQTLVAWGPSVMTGGPLARVHALRSALAAAGLDVDAGGPVRRAAAALAPDQWPRHAAPMACSLALAVLVALRARETRRGAAPPARRAASAATPRPAAPRARPSRVLASRTLS